MIYGLIGIFIGILLASLWEVIYFNKALKNEDELKTSDKIKDRQLKLEDKELYLSRKQSK